MAVEDLYRPYRPKRRTRAAIARERGLEPLADLIWLQNTKRPLEEEAEAYVSEEKGVADAEAALAGAGDILAERIADEAAYRKEIRRRTFQKGILKSAAKDEKVPSVYEMYYGFEEPAAKIAGHRILAVNRGEKEKFLTVKLQAPEEEILCYLEKQVILRENPYTAPLLREVIADSYRRLIAPAIEREIRGELTEKAEDGAIRVFGEKSGTAADAASHCRAGGAGLGSGLPHRLQAGGGGRYRQGAGHGGDSIPPRPPTRQRSGRLRKP